MNSSPLNPDAPVFIPGSVTGADVLLAESPRKPLPMDDIELPDEAQFDTGAVVRPAELLDLDNCDQLNGHHNVSLDEAVKEHLNGNDKCNMDSLGFGFNVGIEPDKVKDSGLIQDFERIQKDTTDFCNIQVFQTHTETNPFAVEGNEELFERLKNKERDPMSMSFYQEKDDDTCERLSKNESHVDLNAVQTLPDSDDEDMQPNGVYENDKENISPDQHTDLSELERDILEPNNDIIRFEDRPGLPQNIGNFEPANHFADFNVTSSNNIESCSNIDFESSNINQDTVLQTDTPESHKLLFEQIPEIPDGKSSELGFTNDETQDPSESEKDVRSFTPQDETSQDIEMESKPEDSPCVETVPQLNIDDIKDDDQVESHHLLESEQVASPVPTDIHHAHSTEQLPVSPAPLDGSEPEESKSPEPVTDIDEIVAVEHDDVQEIAQSACERVTVSFEVDNEILTATKVSEESENVEEIDTALEAPEIKLDTEHLTSEISHAIDEELAAESPVPSKSPLPAETLLHSESPLPTESPLPSESPIPNELHLPVEESLPRESPLPAELALPTESPLPEDTLLQAETVQVSGSPMPGDSPSPLPSEIIPPKESPLPVETEAPTESPIPVESLQPTESPLPAHSPLPANSPLPTESDLLRELPLPSKSPLPSEPLLLSESLLPSESPLPSESLLPSQSPLPSESPLPTVVEPPQSIHADPFETIADSAPGQEEPAAFPAPPAASPAPPAASPAPPVASPAPPAASPAPRAASPLPADVPLPRESPVPVESSVPVVEGPARVESPAPVEGPAPSQSPAPLEPVSLSPLPSAEARLASTPAPSAPAPDLLPDEPAPHSRLELVTDVDIGIPESRAQEICVPVTSEIQLEEAVQPPAAATPPPTPAVEPAAPALNAAPLSDTPMAADSALGAELAVAAAAVAAVGAAAGVAAVKAKPTGAKKSPTTPTARSTPRSAAKSATPARTPTSTTPAPIKRPGTTPAARTPSGKTPTSATKVPSAAKTTLGAKPATPVSKPATPSARTTPAARPTPPATKAPAPVRAAAPARSSLTKPAAAKPAPLAARTASTTTRAAPMARPAPKPATTAARPSALKSDAAAKPAAPRATAPRPALSAARPQPKPADRKPMTNGDAKDTKPAAKPAPRPAPITRPAPRPTPRAPTTTAAAPARPSAPKPAPRAPLDKQSKDLANKRITAKAAPPRTAPPKSANTGQKKAVTKRTITTDVKKEVVSNGLSNGDAALSKPPPSPPAADNALLPDVIA